MKPPFPEYDPKREDPKTIPNADSVEPPNLFEEDGEEVAQISRLRDVPFRMLVPNLITLGAICSGLTSIRLAWEDRYELAIVAIVFAAILDALDGRVARFLKSSSSFGEQLDSLADFVNFGVAPALVLYLWTLNEARTLGWVVALIFAICGCLRLARFNVMLDDPDRPGWQVDFFTGVPAPAGALLVLLPVYMGLLGMERSIPVTVFSAVYMLLVGFLMVSSIPTWSFKRLGGRVSRGMVLPVMLGLVLFFVILFSYPWMVLSCAAFVYLMTMPFSYRNWHRMEVESAAQAAAAARTAAPEAAASAANAASAAVTAETSKPPRAKAKSKSSGAAKPAATSKSSAKKPKRASKPRSNDS
ncbi:MAG: CDP-diacylglycerol--serine O-phosphatidyltransferase [Rhizobiaceae bacterium]